MPKQERNIPLDYLPPSIVRRGGIIIATAGSLDKRKCPYLVYSDRFNEKRQEYPAVGFGAIIKSDYYQPNISLNYYPGTNTLVYLGREEEIVFPNVKSIQGINYHKREESRGKISKTIWESEFLRIRWKDGRVRRTAWFNAKGEVFKSKSEAFSSSKKRLAA